MASGDITGLQALKDRAPLAQLLVWEPALAAEASVQFGEMVVVVPREFLAGAAALLRDHAELRYTFLSDITCVDRFGGEPRFELVYELLSMQRKERVRLKVRLASDSAEVDSLTPLWPGANYFEREVFDMFGIRFTGHPYLRRILMPEEWEGFPLRKDYPVEGYR